MGVEIGRGPKDVLECVAVVLEACGVVVSISVFWVCGCWGLRAGVED